MQSHLVIVPITSTITILSSCDTADYVVVGSMSFFYGIGVISLYHYL